MDSLMQILLSLPAVLFAISMHELAHGYVSYKLGDPTPKLDGRLSLNPLAHIDLVGMLCLILFRFGWAKPVQIDTRYYKHKKRDIILVSLAGVTVNMILALISMFIVALMSRFLYPIILRTNNQLAYNVYSMLESIFFYGVTINIGLGIFNLIPIPPLDGSKVLFSILPRRAYATVLKYERYGMFLLLLLMVTGRFDFIMGPAINFAYDAMAAFVNFLV